MNISEQAQALLKYRLGGNYKVKEIRGGGKSLHIVSEDQDNTVFGKREFTRENWTKGDTTTSNEAFTTEPPIAIKGLINCEAISFRGVNCVIYDHGEGKGDREYGVIMEFHIDPEKIIKLEESGKLKAMCKDPWGV